MIGETATMEKYLDKDADTLEEMLAACTDFRERRNIREALRELKGLKLDGDKIVTYSFGPDALKKLSSLRSVDKDYKSSRDCISSAFSLSNRLQVDSQTKFDSDKTKHVISSIEDRRNENSSFCSYLYAGNINTAQNGKKLKHLSNIKENGCVCLKNSHERLGNISVIGGTGNIVSTKTRSLNSDDRVTSIYNNSRKAKKDKSTSFSTNGLLSPISKTVSKLTNNHETSPKDVVSLIPNIDKVSCDKKVNKVDQKVDTTMKTQDSRRNFSESSVPSPRNELSMADELKKERSKSCNTETDYDIDGVKIRKKVGLSRKNRVEAEWSMSPRLSSKFRRKLGSSSDSISNVNSQASSTDSVNTAVNSINTSATVNGCDLAKLDSCMGEKEKGKKPPTRRKLPDIPVQVMNGNEESDETVHERTLRLLQERRKMRHDKVKKEAETENNTVSNSAVKDKVDDKPRSKKKEIRLRRELQLLNRASESIIAKTESRLSGKQDKVNVEEKAKKSHPLKRSKSDLVRSKPPITPESAATKVEEEKEEVPVTVNLEEFDVMTTENKIDLIGNLMQEEALLQETLRRTTSFKERRKIRSEVRQLREKRTALEGSPEAEPVSSLQRSVSLSAADTASNAKISGELTASQGQKPSIDELRRQLSETSDYDEKKKIRLALRQLRQQSRESDDGKKGNKLHRSQSCVESKSSSKPSVSISGRIRGKNDTVVQTSNTLDSKTLICDTTGLNSDLNANVSAKTEGVKEGLNNQSSSDTTESLKLTPPSLAKRHSIAEIKSDKGRPQEPNRVLSKEEDHRLNSQNKVSSAVNNDGDDVFTKIEITVQSGVKKHSGVSRKSDSSDDSKHSRQLSSKSSHSSSSHSEEDYKSHSKSKTVNSQRTVDFDLNHVKLPETSVNNLVLERNRLSVGEERISAFQSVSSDKPYVKQRKHSLESLADSYRLRDQEDKNNRQFNSKLLNSVIGQLEDKITKSTSKILISRADSESTLLKRLKDADNKSKEYSIKQLKDSENLSKTQHICDRTKDSHIYDGERSVVNGFKNENSSIYVTKLHAAQKAKSEERLSPNIPWLEEKKKSSPTPNDLDKLMSTMDIENAFSQILDAVEHFPVGTDTSEPSTPDTPIVPIVEEDRSTESSASCIESASEEVDENKNVLDHQRKHEQEQVKNDKCSSKELRNLTKKDSEMEDSKEIEVKNKDDSNKQPTIEAVETKCAINSNSGIIKKSEAKIQLKSNLSLDLTATPKENSAISVIHGDDGTLTVQEVNRVQEGDTVITEWKKVRRTQSRTEERETDTVKERLVTSPGGSSSVYEKDVSKTKRKLTSRGSDYFTRNNYNLRRLKDVEGTEIVEHELISESENMSVTKNESWGSKSEAKVSLNKDSNSDQNVKAITPDLVPEPIKEEGEMTLTSGHSRSKHSHMTVSKTSSGYGSVSGSEEDDREEVLQMSLGRPSDYRKCSVTSPECYLCDQPLHGLHPVHGWRICCPVISSNLKEVEVFEGSTAVLECSVTSSPLPTVTWYKGTTALLENDQTTFHFDGAMGKASLEITDVTCDDDGEYTCVFSNPLGIAQTKAKLNIKKRALGPPSFVTELKDVTVSEGCSVVLECEVTATDSVSWYKDGIIQRNSADFKQTFNGTRATLEIGEVFLDDDGKYTCALKNKNAESRCSCKVTVTEAVSDDIVAPAFLKKLETQIVDEQDMVIMECDIIGSPQPIITWYCDRKPLLDGDKFSMSYDGRVARLIMKSSTKGDNGKYECVAESSAGRIACDCLLVVRELRVPPSVTKPLSDVTVDDGNAIMLECCIMGNPVPQIAWRKNGLIIGQMFDFKQTYTDGVAKLEITKACVQDSGCYECVATSDLGEVTTSCNLNVQAKTISKSSSNTPDEKVLPVQDEKASTQSGRSKTKGVKHFPSNFTAISDDHQAKAAKSQASKVMLVRQSSLRSVGQENKGITVKRSESLRLKQNKGKDIAVPKSDMKEQNKTDESENPNLSKTVLIKNLEPSAKEVDKVSASGLKSEHANIDSANVSSSNSEKETLNEVCEKSSINSLTEERTSICNSVPKIADIKTTVTFVKPNEDSKEVKENIVISSGERKIDAGKKKMELLDDKKLEIKTSDEHRDNTELDFNENIKVEEKSTSVLVDNKENLNGKDTAKETEISKSLSKDSVAPKLVVAVSAKETEKTKSSVFRDIKDSAIAKFEKLCSDTQKNEVQPKFKSGLEVRRTQSVRTPGSEKPEWLQMKLKKVGEAKSPNVTRKVTTQVEKDIAPSNDLLIPTSVPKDIKLNRSNSARDTERKLSPLVTDSAKSPLADRSSEKAKLTPVSERAKIFQMNNDSSPFVERKNPSAIIAKAINLSRAESMKAPVGHKNLNIHNVQRSHSFKTSDPSSAIQKEVIFDPPACRVEGQEKTGESGVAKKPIKYWDPNTAPTTNMAYASMTDLDELQRLLTASDNFEERKQLRARIKELREIRDKKWEEEKKQREAGQEDLLKKKQREADLEKQRKLEAYKVQAAQPHESKHLEVREQRLKEKMREAEERKQKELEAYDRMARKEDTSAKSSVHTEVQGGKTVTVRKVETVSKTGGVGGTSYGKPAEIIVIPSQHQGGGDNEKHEEEAEALVKRLINASSPTVSGVLNVKTESWSSKDGITHKSEKTESWGAKKPASAMNAFKQMDKQNNPQTNLGAPGGGKGLARSPSAIKTMLLEWTKAMTREYVDTIDIQNFSTSWNDGIAFCALIHHFYPESFDFKSLDPKQRRRNFELAFDTAEKYADIAPLLDVEDMVKMKKPDWKCVFTYVQSFYRKLKDHENNKVKSEA